MASNTVRHLPVNRIGVEKDLHSGGKCGFVYIWWVYWQRVKRMYKELGLLTDLGPEF